MLEQLTCEENKFRRVRHIHGQHSSKYVEPHAVDDFGHVTRPICLVHSLDLLFRKHLLVDASLTVTMILQSSRLVVQVAIKAIWEDFVHVFDFRN